MKRHLLAVLLAAAASTALAQSNLDQARGTQRVVDQGNARVQQAADAQLQQADEPRAAPGQAAPAGQAPGEGIPAEDLALPGAVEGGARDAEEGRGTLPPPDTYTIRPGDTLWDLSGRFLNNPWYWPKVWSYNPEIENPHWIYPGNVLRFYPSEEEAPVRVEPIEGGEPVVAEEEEPEAPRELEDFSKADMKGPETEEMRDAVAVSGPYKIGYVPPRATLVRRDAFVTPRELAESGKLAAAAEEKLLLTSHDRVYARFQEETSVKMGETYVLYRTLRPVKHPVTGELFGYQTEVLGAGKVVSVEPRAATLVIQHSFEAIQRGDMLGPWTEKVVRRVERRPNAVALEGYVIGSQVTILTMAGENNVVFLDRGSADGVEEGNTFRVLRSGDPLEAPPATPQWDPSLPVETIGELLVVDVKERASAALVLRSLREIMIGDRLEMRPVVGGAGGN